VSHYALPHLGGIEVVVHELAEEFARRGHEVAVVSSGIDSKAPGPPRSYRIARVPALNVFERTLGIPYPLFSPKLVEVLRRELADADVVHAHGFLYASSVAALGLARRMRRLPPVRVLTEHVGRVPYDNAVLDSVQAAAAAGLGRFCVRAAQAVVVVNGRVADEMRALAAGQPVVTIHNGVDTTLFRPHRAGEREQLREELGWDGQPRVLFVGRPVAKKGFDVAVEATRRAGGAFALAVAGFGPAELPAGLQAKVEHLGRLPADRLANVYRAADALLVVGRGEGLPLTAQEAMASGLPVVIRGDPGYHDALDGAGPAVRLVSSDPRTIAATLLEVVGDERLRALAMRTSCDFVQRTFSWARAADAHEALYRCLGAPA
jgi:glycosyltransferase involved in cell wall biosynthesis